MMLNEPKHHQDATQAGGRKDEKAVEERSGEGYLRANANLAGRMGMSGAVAKATKKQTAAPNKHAPKPINLGEGDLVLIQLWRE